MSSNIWFTSDTHFSHANILKHCNRPFSSVEAMDQDMASRWNSTVGKDDTVYILGDFAWKNHAHWIHALNGNKILVFGNHDKMAESVYRSFTKVYGGPKQPGICQNTLGGKYMVMCHYPLYTWNGRWHDSVCLSAHTHGRYRPARPGETSGGLILEVGWDLYGRPIELQEVCKYLDDKLAIIKANEPTTKFRRLSLHLAAIGRILFSTNGGHYEKDMDSGYDADFSEQLSYGG